jgi:FG-GAP repeat
MKQFRDLLLPALAAGLFGLTCSQSFGALGQQAYVKASNTGEFDGFGTTVAISSDTLIVGSPYESSNATGVNGNQNNELAPYSGAAYIYVRSGTNWTQQAYLKASENLNYNEFGSTVAIDGDTVVIGAPYANPGGSAYVFVRTGTNWTQQALLKASNRGGNFGNALSISGDTIVVAAYREGNNATGINGVQTNYTSMDSGAAYVFVRNGTTWTQQAYVKASNAQASDYFGGAIGLAGDTMVVGAREEDGFAGVNGPNNNLAFASGAAYVFLRTGTNWTQQAYLKASNIGLSDAFGHAVAVFDDTVVVGAIEEDSNATGVNGNQANNDSYESGAAYVFVRTGTNWTQQAYLKASNPDEDDHFGFAVAGAGHTIVIGARDEDSNGEEGNNTATNSGAAYVFTRTGTNWVQSLYLKASNPGGGNASYELADQFGGSVAISGGSLAIGAPGEASNATGVNGNQADNSLPLAGAAYVFTGLGSPPPVSLLYGVSGNSLNLSWSGAATLEAAQLVTGLWLPVTNAVSPYQTGPTNQQRYFRLRLP